MRVKFSRPVQGYGYFKGDVGDVPDEVAARMVKSGAVILHQGEDPVSLPEGMPARKILHDNGFRTVAEADRRICLGNFLWHQRYIRFTKFSQPARCLTRLCQL